MGLTQAARNAKPKKPLTFYFKFRGEKLQQLKNEENRISKVNELWTKVDDKEKQRQNQLFKKELQAYKIQMQAWMKKFNLKKSDLEDEKDEKKKSKKGKQSSEEKPAKTKGEGKKEKSVEKTNKSKDAKDAKEAKDAKNKGKDDKKPTEIQTKNKDKKKK